MEKLNLYRACRQSALSMAERLKQEARIFTIGVTNQTDDALLSALSSGGLKNLDWFSTPTFEGLQEIRDQVVEETCLAQTQTTPPLTTRKPHPAHAATFTYFE